MIDLFKRPLDIAIVAIVSLFVVACDATSSLAKNTEQSRSHQERVGRYTAMPGVLRVALDNALRRAWVLTGDGVDLYDTNGHAKLASIRLLGWTWVGSPDACTPDLEVLPGGHVVVSSNIVPVLWRIDATNLAVTEHQLAVDVRGMDIGFSGLTYAVQQDALFAINGMDGSLWQIDGSLTRAERVLPSAIPPGWRAELRRRCDAGTSE